MHHAHGDQANCGTVSAQAALTPNWPHQQRTDLGGGGKGGLGGDGGGGLQANGKMALAISRLSGDQGSFASGARHFTGSVPVGNARHISHRNCERNR
jgi:hypothetical protein